MLATGHSGHSLQQLPRNPIPQRLPRFPGNEFPDHEVGHAHDLVIHRSGYVGAQLYIREPVEFGVGLRWFREGHIQEGGQVRPIPQRLDEIRLFDLSAPTGVDGSRDGRLGR